MAGLGGQALMDGMYPQASRVPLDPRLGSAAMITPQPLQLIPYVPTWYPPADSSSTIKEIMSTPSENEQSSGKAPGVNIAIPHPPIPIPDPWEIAIDATKLLAGAAGAVIAVILSVPGASEIKDKNGPDVYLFATPPWYDTGTMSCQAVLWVKGEGKIVSLPGLSVGMFWEGTEVAAEATREHQEKYAHVNCGYFPNHSVIQFEWQTRASASVWVSKPGSLNVHRQLPDRSEVSRLKFKTWS